MTHAPADFETKGPVEELGQTVTLRRGICSCGYKTCWYFKESRADHMLHAHIRFFASLEEAKEETPDE